MARESNKQRLLIIVAILILGILTFLVRNHFFENKTLLSPSGESLLLCDGGICSHEKTNHVSALPPCGQICSYDASTVGRYPLFDTIKKSLNCMNIMKRMAYKDYKVTYPPLKDPPQEQLQEFTQYGHMDLGPNYYVVDFRPGKNPRYRQYGPIAIKKYMDLHKNGTSVNAYRDGGSFMNLINKYGKSFINKSGVVVGTIAPWLESMLLAENAKHVTTLEYGNLGYNHTQLNAINPYDFAEQFVNNKAEIFDFGVSFSSLEHSGLGRYGDPINPYGDFEAMAQAWCFTKPGGMFLVGVPYSRKDKGLINWNAHRIYGNERLKHLSANWEVLDHTVCNDRYHHIVLVLRKPVLEVF